MDFQTASKLTDEQARAYLESLRWPNGAVCPHCGQAGASKLNGKATRPGVHKCKNRECRKQFTVTVGTIFERSHIGLREWVMAFALVCASKKGISALQLQRMLGLKSYKSAWHLAHRIRHAMRSEPLRGMLAGTIEMDETYVGGKPRKRVAKPGDKPRKSTKTPVVALIQRDGQMRAKAYDRVTGENLRQAVRESVDVMQSKLMTDELRR
jgi:transposase-like protein